MNRVHHLTAAVTGFGLGIASLGTFSEVLVLAQPITSARDGTGTIITPDGNRIDISGGSLSADGKNLFHSFQQFGLDANQIANFLANPTLNTIFSRVVGGDASVINGLIQVTGGNPNLYLINPAGMVFGASSRLNVPADFIATTATGMGFGDNHWFNAVGENAYQNLVGTPNQFAFDQLEAGSIVNGGDLAVSQGQNLTLLAGNVINTGTLTAPGGTITVAAVPGANLVKISQKGQLLSLEIEAPRTPSRELLPIKPLDLAQLLTGKGEEVETGVEVNQSGDVQLTDTGVTLPKQTGLTIVSGEIDVSVGDSRLDSSSSLGGEVNIIGNTVGLIAANVDASGRQGGGNVRIGGGEKGQEPIPNADVTFVSNDATINANALDQGHGGRVMVWSQKTTRTYGHISARGGVNGGNGGFVETSSAGFLDVPVAPDITAPTGNGGTWLIDPYNITISGVADQTSGTAPNFTATADNSVLNINTLLAALTQGDVTVDTGSSPPGIGQAGNITLATDLDFNGKGGKTLTLIAANNIFINGQIWDSDRITTPTDGLNLDFRAGGAVEFNQSISTAGFDLTVTAKGAITQGNDSSLDIGGRTRLTAGDAENPTNITLNHANNNFNEVVITNANQVKLTDVNDIALGSSQAPTISNIQGNFSLTSQGVIQQVDANDSLVVAGKTRLDANGNDIILNNDNNLNQVIVTRANNVSLNDINEIQLGTSPDDPESTISGTLDVTATDVSINSTVNVGNATFEPINPTSTIGIGDGAPGNFLLTEADLTNLESRGTVKIGSPRVTGEVTIGDVNLRRERFNLTVQGGNPTFQGNLNVANDLTVTATTDNINQNSGTIIKVNGTATLAAGNNQDITLDNTDNDFNTIVVNRGNDVTLNDKDNLNLNSVSIAGTLGVTAENTISTTGDINAGAVNLRGDGITLNSTIETSDRVDNNVILTGSVRLREEATINTDNPNNDGDITINQSINGAGDLTLDAGNGDITINEAIGRTTAPLNVSLNGGTITLANIGKVTEAGVSDTATINATEAINFTGEIYNAQNQNYTAGTAFNLNQTTTFTSDGGAIAFNTGTIRGTETNPANLALDADTGRVTVGAIGNGNEIKNLRIQGREGITLNGDITTADAANNTINLNSRVTLGEDITVTNQGGKINFNDSVDGSQDLTVNADNSTVVFADDVGNRTALTNLTVNKGESVTFDNRVTVADSINLTADEIDFNGGVNSVSTPNQGTISLKPTTDKASIDIGSPANGEGSLDISDRDLGAIADGFSQITIGRETGNGEIVLDSQGVSFHDPVTIQSPTSGGEIKVNGNLTGTDDAAITINGENIYLGNPNQPNVTLETAGQPITLSQTIWLYAQEDVEVKIGGGGGDVTFRGDVTGRKPETQSLIVTPGTGNVSFQGEIGQPHALKTLRIGDDTTINADIVGTSTTVFDSLFVNAQQSRVSGRINTRGGSIEFTGDVILVRDTQFDTISQASPGSRGGDISFGATVSSAKETLGNSSSTSPFDLHLNSGSGNVTFAGAVGAQNFGGGWTTTDLGALTIERATEVIADSTMTTLDSDGIKITADTIQLRDDIQATVVELNGTDDISTASITATEDGITIDSATGSIDTSQGKLTAPQGDVNLTANQAGITTADIEAESVNLQANNTITTADVSATQGGITMTNPFGSIQSGDLTAQGETPENAVMLTTPGNITTGHIDTSSAMGKGGAIALTSQTGDITSGNLNSSGALGGGAIDVSSLGQLTVAEVNSSSTAGLAGLITLNNRQPEFIKNSPGIDLIFINAQGLPRNQGAIATRPSETEGIEITINITTDGYFRATGTFRSQTGIEATLATGGDPIVIRHGGGTAFDPFEVGNPTQNGTTGAITNGKGVLGSILPMQSFTLPVVQDNIEIIPRIPSQSNLPLSNISPQLPVSSQVADADLAISTLDRLLADTFSGYLGPKPSVNNPADAAEILEQIEQQTGVKSAFIYAIFVADNLELIMVSAQEKKVVSLPDTTPETIRQTAQKLRREITNPIKRRTSSYLAPAQQLYQWLIAPLKADLDTQGIQNLVFIMDRGLRSLPVAALHDGQGFLVENYSVGLMPSLSITDTSYNNIQNVPVLAMGIAESSDLAKELNLSSLPAVPLELQTIASIRDGESFLNEKVTLESLKAHSQNASIVHLATHGEFKPGSLENSYILLWNDLLRLNQLRELGWNNRRTPIELLILSACRTAVGDEKAELGFAGLAVQAGVKSALSSLWYVSDEGTSGLMTEFYRKLQTAPIKAEALRQAQLAMIKGEVRLEGGQLRGSGQPVRLPPTLETQEDKSLSHPYYWAAFTLIGSPW
ncbi:CHAT domain-containing protein [Coleofasciculus sp. E2-BRE-01]|uniref:CHAT domain-containing protein n=1 Tax=Coleofasciculus sp. E2-BRE-01 TaxID=3069524 RepID=UPI003303AAA8